LLHFI